MQHNLIAIKHTDLLILQCAQFLQCIAELPAVELMVSRYVENRAAELRFCPSDGSLFYIDVSRKHHYVSI